MEHSDRKVASMTELAAPPGYGVGVPAEEVIDLRILFSALRRRKLIFFLAIVAGISFGVWQVRKFIPQYVASIVVTPSVSGGAMPYIPGGQLGQLVGLARGFGVNVGAIGAVTTFDRLKLVVSSITLAKTLHSKYGYLQKVFKDSWGPVEKKWLRPSGTAFEWEQRIRGLFQLSTWSEPTTESLAKYLKGAILFEQVEESPFQRISFEHTDSDFALEFLNIVYTEADELLRQQDRGETAARKAYLEEKLQGVSMIEMRVALVSLLTNEERTAMLLEGNLPYAARVMEPAFVSSKQTEPILLIMLGAPVAGFFGITAIVLILIELLRLDSSRIREVERKKQESGLAEEFEEAKKVQA